MTLDVVGARARRAGRAQRGRGAAGGARPRSPGVRASLAAVTGAVDHLGDPAVRRLAGGQPDGRVARRLRRRRRRSSAWPARWWSACLGGDRRRDGRDLHLGDPHQDLPRRAGRRRDLRAPARALQLLERRRPDRRARRAGRRCGSARGARGTRPSTRSPTRRSACCCSRCCWPTRAARCWRWRSAARSGSPSCRCGCAASAVLAAGALGALAVAAWAFSQDTLTKDNVDVAQRATLGPRARDRHAGDAARAAARRPGRELRRRPPPAVGARRAGARAPRSSSRSRSCRSRSSSRSRSRARAWAARSPAAGSR